MAIKWWPWQRKSVRSGGYELLRELLNQKQTASGRAVNVSTSLRVATVLACVRVIAEGLAQVPLKLFQEGKGGEKSPAKSHPLYQILHLSPNAVQTSYEYRETIGLQAGLCGNHYSFISRSGSRVLELLPIDPRAVEVMQLPDWSVRYIVTGKDGQRREVPAENIFHVRGPSWNGFSGLNVMELAREAVGLSLATEEAHAKLHKNQSKPGGILSVDGKLSQDQYKQLRDWIAQNFEGEANAFKTMILDNGAKWTGAVMNGVDAQHLETRRYEVEEICRFFRVMPIMIGHADKTATYASAEQMFLAHVVHTLSPWYARLEQRMDVSLLTQQEQKQGYYCKFIEEGLLRADMAGTAAYLERLSNGGIMTRNEARAKLDMNPLPGLGDPLTPANMIIGAKPQTATPVTP